MLRRLNELIEGLNEVSRTAVALAFVMLLGILDLATGRDVSFLVLYLLPIGFAAWYASRALGFVVAAFATAFWLVDNAWGRPWMMHDVWDFVEKGGVLSLVSLLVSRLRLTLDHEALLARTDVLTGLANRRVLFESLESECREMSRHREPMTLVYIDLDRFKEVNDKQGHAEGDRLLCTVAGLLRGATRPTDLVARVGGDEFAVLLPRTDRLGAERIADRLREDLALAATAHGWPVTFSAGAVTWTPPCAGVDELMHVADALMYEAKCEGRNRTAYRTAGAD